jgi:hypothetical protein
MDQHVEVIGLYPLVPWRNIRGMRNRIAHGAISRPISRSSGTLCSRRCRSC